MMRLFGRGHLTVPELSALLDGRGNDRGHLASCEVCRSELASLEATRGYLGSMSEVTVPESLSRALTLALSPGERESPIPARRGGFGSWLPAMRMATAGVAALLVFSVGIDVFALSGMRASAPMGQMAYDAAATQEKAAADEGTRAPAAAPALRSAPSGASAGAGAGPAETTTVVVPEGVRPHPSPLPEGEGTVSRGPGVVTSGLGVIFVLLFAATTGLWIRERSR